MTDARDPVVRALGGLTTGAASGAGIITAGLLALRTIQQRGVLETRDTGLSLLSASVLAGMAVAAASGWVLSRGIEDAWRRGLTATLAVFGALMLSLAAVPADLLGGRVGLAGYLVLLLAGGAYTLGRARRAA